MIRYLIAALALIAAVGSPLAAEEPGRFSAKVKMELRSGDSTFSLETTVGGPLDRPQKIDVGGLQTRKNMGPTQTTKVELNVEPVLMEKTWLFTASFRVVQKRDDGKDRVLAEPTIITVAGRHASFFTGAADGDHVQVEFTPEVK